MSIQNLDQRFSITDKNGNPTDYFMRIIRDRGQAQTDTDTTVSVLTADVSNKVDKVDPSIDNALVAFNGSVGDIKSSSILAVDAGDGTSDVTGLHSLTISSSLINADAVINAEHFNGFKSNVYSNTASPYWLLSRQRGSIASPTATLVNDSLGNLGFRNSQFNQDNARISATATEGSATGNGARLQFFTVPNGSTASPPERLRIDQDGVVRAFINFQTVDDAYAIGWNGSLMVPTKNAVYDQMELRATKATTVIAGTGLSGGGDLSANRTISLANTAVTAGTYGDATHVAQITVDAQGRLTAASAVAITGGGGGGSTWAVVQDHTVGATEAHNDINVSAYDEVLVQFLDVTSGGANQRGVQVSTDGGVTFFSTSGDYSAIAAAGTKTSVQQFNAHSTGATAARGGFVHIKGLRQSTAPKTAIVGASDTDYVFLASNAAITHIRQLTGAGATNMTGGRIITYGR